MMMTSATTNIAQLVQIQPSAGSKIDQVVEAIVTTNIAQLVQIQPSAGSKIDQAVEAIVRAMRNREATVVGCSYGKDSSCVLALTLEAARRLKDREGLSKRVIVLTADTGVENPSMIKLAHKMSAQMLTFADERGLDVTQRWVTPAPMDNYLVTMIGGRGTASVPGTSSSCTLDLKIRPMQKVTKALADEFGAENILTLIGTRFDESTTRGNNMRKRGESALAPQKQDSGSWLLSPIANWVEGDVWAFLNAGEKRRGFESLDFTLTLSVYETIGESTCSIGAIDPSFQQQSAGGCGSAGRTGCWACQRVTRDSSLESMLDQMPAYEPLVRLSKAIRAGHFVPANRSFLGKTIQDDGRIRAFSNGYSPQWTQQLLAWTLTVDADEDDRAARTGKARRFPRLLTEESLLLIAFQWSRYGLHEPGAFIRIYHAVATGARFPLPTDQELADMAAKGDRSLMGKTLGWIDTGVTPQSKPVFRDNWRDMLGRESACSVPVMAEDNEVRYQARSGAEHDSLVYSDGIEAAVDHLRDPDSSMGIAFMDFMSWYAMEFAAGRKSHADELNWLIREGVIRARRGYQSRIALYQQFTNTLAELGLTDASLKDILNHPAFTTEEAPAANTEGYPGEQLSLVA